ncbi:MAG: 3-phosphoshikimate 1-carboxyvinyltransferase [Chloroflexi bacterium]|nr:3-phosphoshikimate 1-carboxyvinyltransferase [Chloroflexota bacterium]|tara:strand:- start:15894 stop:17189 length:1296 start_codon:yes stop_codon:yes gene_type:complete
MNKKIIRPKKLRGTITPPGDKSISHRALMINAIAGQTASINGILESEDIQSTINCLRQLGVEIEMQKDGSCQVKGLGINGLKATDHDLDCGNSGTTIRLLMGLIANIDGTARLTGDNSLQSRPMERVYSLLNAMGANIFSEKSNGCAPIIVEGKQLTSNQSIEMTIASAQIKSALILAGLSSNGILEIIEPFKSRDHTERMLSAMGAKINVHDNKVTVYGDTNELQSIDIDVPSDISSAAPWIVAGILHPDAEIVIKNVCINQTRSGIIDVFVAMGAKIEIMNKRLVGNEEVADLGIYSSSLSGIQIDKELIPRAIDEIPLIALGACFANGNTKISNISELKVKESNRLTNTIEIINQFGGEVFSCEDELLINGLNSLHGAKLYCGSDHRMTMLAGIASLVSEEESELMNIDSVNVSYPNFWNDFEKLCVS